MNPNYGLMIELKPKFQRKLFINLFKNNNIQKLTKLFNRSQSNLYHYKNCRIKKISIEVINKAIKLTNTNKEELEKNTIKILSAKEERRRIFDLGINFRRDYLKKHFTINIKLNEFVIKEQGSLSIDLQKWLEKTKWIKKLRLISGIIKNIKEPKIKKGNIILEYEIYKKDKKRREKVINIIPRRIKIDEEFLYFLGLRYGDGTNGARIGIINKNLELIKETSIYLKKLFPESKIEGTINTYKKLDHDLFKNLESKMNKIVDNLTIQDFKKYDIKGDYVMTIFVVNEFFNRIYKSLINGLDSLFKKLNFTQKGAFLAGFFDAEGNVNKLDKNFRWSQKIEKNVEIIKNLLEEEGYHVRYDGSNLNIAHRKEFWKSDLTLFKKQVLPFIKHPEKKKEAIELLNGYYVRDCYKELVKIVIKNPNIDNIGIRNIIKRKRSHRELKALAEAGFLTRTRKRVDESFKYHTTEKGIKWINNEIDKSIS